MHSENRRLETPLFLVLLMVLAPFAGAATVTDFGNGNPTADIEFRDGTPFINTNDGIINLPADETVVDASMTVSTDMLEHAAHSRVDIETMPRVWNPMYNNQLTKFSNETHFVYEEGSNSVPVRLKSEGFLTDFEETTSGFIDHRALAQDWVGWDHGQIDTNALPPNTNIPPCASGEYCWGTGLMDEDYTDEYVNGNNGRVYLLTTASIYVDSNLKNHMAYFDSWHDLDVETGSGGQTNPPVNYRDCAYVEIRSSFNDDFVTSDPTGFEHVDIDLGNSSGLGYGNGYYVRSSGASNAGQIDYRCGGVASGDYAIAGSSTSVANPNGWASLAVDLAPYIGKYIEMRFVVEDNNVNNADGGKAGWYIDNFRVGDRLPQSSSMDINGFLPYVQTGDNQPNGYGILTIESETTTSATLNVEVHDSSTGQTITDRNGKLMTGLQGKIIELWDIDSSAHPSIDFTIEFNSGPSRLSSPVLHGFSIGTRVGTGFNQTDDMTDNVVNGVWETPGQGMPIMYSPLLMDDTYSPVLHRSNFDRPITSVTPMIQDDCAEVPSLDLMGFGGIGINGAESGTTYTLAEPWFGFDAQLMYQNACNVGGLWFDLEFGHHATHVQLDVGNDGTVDWGFDEPAFGSFGRQTEFLKATIDGVNYGQSSSNLTIDQSGVAEGAMFMLPKGAEVTSVDFAFDQMGIFSSNDLSEGFELSLLSGTQEVVMGSVANISLIFPEYLPEDINMKTALNSLLSNPLVPTSYYDEYGNEWQTFRLKANSPNASTGAQMTVRGLDIVYNYSVVLGTSDGLDIELNKGIALWQGGSNAEVELMVTSSTGGTLEFSDLLIETSAGYTNTISAAGNPVGLYPNGEIYEISTTHTVSSLTGTSLAEAILAFESQTGSVLLSYSNSFGFTEADDELDLITLESSSVMPISEGLEVTWRFTVNSNWEDTEEVRIYSGLVTANGINGLPDALLMAPNGGNAVENDAQITSFQVENNIGIAQDLDDGKSGQLVTVSGSIRLQDLSISPDPSGYFMVLEQKFINNSNGNISVEWHTVANQSGVIGGDFNWQIDLGMAAGQDTYRFRIDGYEGGDTLCPAAEYRPDSSCAIPFNLSIDTLDPNLVDVRILNGEVDPSVESNWRVMVDDTWVVPSTTQKIRLNASDLPNPPSSLNIMVWVEHDHDTNGDGQADADEYITVTANSDGAAPFANYTATFNDYANVGKDPVGKVSIWIEGFDLAGNAINGGAPGFENDKFTYVSMSSKSPVIRNFFVEDSQESRFLKSNQQQYNGKWNQTMYAGNEYHLIVEANDDNGWRDVDYFRVDLADDRDDMTVWFFPRNQTAWTSSPFIEILGESATSQGPQVLRMDGGVLIDPFESDFSLDLPIRMTWGLPGASSSLNNPVLYMQDLDNPRYRMLPAPGRHIQDWYYSDGIQLDFRADTANDLMVTPTFMDLMEPKTNDVRKGFVYPGDIIGFEGQYAYVEGINNEVYITPETELTLEITRQAASMDGAKGYIAFPGEVTYHSFTGGVFDINITAPPVTNEYTYVFRLCPYDATGGSGGVNGECGNGIAGLPLGAVDSTSAFCAGSASYGCQNFKIKVDGTAPRVSSNSWSAMKGLTNEPMANVLPTSTFHCVDVQVALEEREAMFQGDVFVSWSFYTDSSNNITWPIYRSTFGDEPMSHELIISESGGSYSAVGDCIDLWPLSEGQDDPEREQISNVDIVFWIDATDSAGTRAILGGGPNEDGSIGFINSGDPVHKSMYELIHEEASFLIDNVIMSPSSPEVGDKVTLEIEVRNDGTMDGSTDLNIRSVIGGSTPIFESSVSTGEIAVGQKSWISVELQQFNLATTGMYYMISDNTTNELLFNGSSVGESFNVKVESQSSDSTGFVVLASILGIAVAVLGTLVFVLIRRSGESDLFDEDDESDSKTYVDIPQQSSTLSGPPPAASSLSPEMRDAMQKFPQWTQEEIQGYFDQGWSVQALLEWVESQ